MKTVLFACVHNAGRSQIAAAWFNRLAESADARAISAGTKPASQVHSSVIEVMREVGIELAGAVPQKLTEEVARQADVLVTMGCGDTCPVVPGARVEDWPLQDPKDQPLAAVRRIRDDIRARVEALLAREGLAKRSRDQS
jgi:arsenate reductase (thioredoxin)